MQIIPQEDRLVIISEDPRTTEDNKVLALKWADIKTITFIYPPKNIWRTLKSIGELTVGIFLGFNGNNLLGKTICIDIELNDGKKISIEFHAHSIKHGQKLEQALLNHLNTADT